MAFHGSRVGGRDITAAGHRIADLDEIALFGLGAFHEGRGCAGQSDAELDDCSTPACTRCESCSSIAEMMAAAASEYGSEYSRK